jgi:signal transduction histidine kinase
MGYLSYSALISITSLIILTTGTVIASCVFFIKHKNNKRSLYLLLNIVLAFWALSFMFFFNAPDKLSAVMWYKVGAVAYCTYYAFALHFTLLLGKSERMPKLKKAKFIIHGLLVPFIVLFMAGNLTFLSFYKSNGIWMYSIDSPDLWFVFYTLSTIIPLCITIRFRKSETTRFNNKSIATLFSFQFVALILGFIVNVVLPMTNIPSIPPIAHIVILAYTIIANYVLRRHSFISLIPSIAARQIMKKVTDMVILTDPDGKIVEVNDSLKDLSGFDDIDLVGKDINFILSPGICLCKHNYKATGFNLLTRFSDSIPVKISSSEILAVDKTLLGNAYILQDLRLLVKLQDEAFQRDTLNKSLSQTNERIKEFDKLKTDFFCNVSHELRTPLTLMISSLKLSSLKIAQNRGEVDPIFMYKHFEIMNQNCFRLMKIINNIIDITKVDAGSMELNLSNSNIVEIVEEAALSVSMFIKKKGMTLIFDTDAEEKYMACDAEQIQRILLNLISNAVKFNAGGGEIFVSVCAADSENSVKISVKDSGIGISPDDQQVIFERFIQVDKSLTRKHEGSGIGLTLAKSLVELHNGTITLESEPGIGSTFTITLPVYLIPDSKLKRCPQFSTIGEKVNIEFSDVF